MASPFFQYVVLDDGETLNIVIRDTGSNTHPHTVEFRHGDVSVAFYVCSLADVTVQRITHDTVGAVVPLIEPPAKPDRPAVWPVSQLVRLSNLLDAGLVTPGESVVAIPPGGHMDRATIMSTNAAQPRDVLVLCTENGPVKSSRFEGDDTIDNRPIAIEAAMLTEAADWIAEQGREPQAVGE